MQTSVGFIGAGSVARRHADTLAGLQGVRIAAVTDVSAQAAQEFAALTGASACRDVEALLDHELDAVYVCVPPFAHGNPERRLVAAGLPLFVEKPLALDAATAEEIGAAVVESGVITATGYHWRYLEGAERVRELLAESPARLAIGAWLDKVPPPAWWIRRRSSGGQTIEQTTHVLDLLLYLMGDVREVYALASRSERPAFPDADIDDVASAVLRFASGAVGSLASTCLLAGKHRAGVELFCDGHHAAVQETDFAIDGASHEDRGRAKVRVDRDFIDAVRGGENRIRAPYDVALRTHRVACLLADSAETGHPLAVPAGA